MSHYLAITGGRDFDDEARVREAFELYSHFYDDIRLLHGDAPGADRLAARIADQVFGWPVKAFPADWTGPCDPKVCKRGHRQTRNGRDYCPAAGVRRNAYMVSLLEKWSRSHEVTVIAFPGGNGTADMIERCEAADLPVSLM